MCHLPDFLFHLPILIPLCHVTSALSEIIGSPLPYDSVVELRDRMWEISPTLVRYDMTESTSPSVVLAGLKALEKKTGAVTKVSGVPFKKPIENFYQTDPISRAYVFFFSALIRGWCDWLIFWFLFYRSVIMAQCTKSFVKGESLRTPEQMSEAAFA